MAQNDGGAAFPLPQSLGWQTQHGLSKREWFAGLAMLGDLSSMPATTTSIDVDRLASRARQVADAMLRALAEEPTP